MRRRTPTTPKGLRKYDHLPPAEAAQAAWAGPGTHTAWHQATKEELHLSMPLLARALDRLTKDTR